MGKLNNKLKMQTIKQKLKEQFLRDDRPWVVAFSGGKDSTLVLHLVIEMLIELKKENKLFKHTYIISSDTKIEMPLVEKYLENKLKEIDKFCKKMDLDVSVHLIKPDVKDSFFALMIGKGYPSPNKWFRWCTDRLKIRPTTTFLNKLVNKHQSIVMLLGVRSDESISRANSIQKRELNFNGLSMHDQIPNAYVYAPIKNITTKELWQFLENNSSPWGNHNDLIILYQKGMEKTEDDEDCNMILNQDSPSCGKTRFGCWTCTVVEKDKSMEGMLLNGEEWMKPLLAYRKVLLKYRDDETKRQKRRRNGQLGLGAFYLETRVKLLEKLLKIENEKEFKKRKIELISDEEIAKIQEYWDNDGDISNQAIKLANKYGRNFIIENDLQISENELFMRLYEIEKNRKNISNRQGILKEIEERVLNYYKGEFLEDK